MCWRLGQKWPCPRAPDVMNIATNHCLYKQPFGAGQFAQANFGCELPAGGGAHKDRGRWIVDDCIGEGGKLLGFDQPPDQLQHVSQGLLLGQRSGGEFEYRPSLGGEKPGSGLPAGPSDQRGSRASRPPVPSASAASCWRSCSIAIRASCSSCRAASIASTRCRHCWIAGSTSSSSRVISSSP